jgi:hypothetical protein
MIGVLMRRRCATRPATNRTMTHNSQSGVKTGDEGKERSSNVQKPQRRLGMAMGTRHPFTRR